MKLPRFKEFIENKVAHEYATKLAEFNSRFSDPALGEAIVKKAGYESVRDFLQDPDEKKWCKLRIPGQENYVH